MQPLLKTFLVKYRGTKEKRNKYQGQKCKIIVAVVSTTRKREKERGEERDRFTQLFIMGVKHCDERLEHNFLARLNITMAPPVLCKATCCDPD